MKAVIITVGALLLIAGLTAAISIFANPATNNTPATLAVASAPTSAEVAAAREPVHTLCRTNEALMELCISSDDRGLFSVFDGVETARYVYVFYDTPGGCPPDMPGYQVRVTDWALRDLQYVGFDAGDFAALNVSEYYCSFAPLP